MYKRAVIGVDPGKTTGIFAWRYFECSPGFIGSKPVHGFDARHVPAAEVPRVMRYLLHVEYVDLAPAVAVERFVINARTAKLSQQPDALEVTGMVKGIASLTPMAEVRQYLKSNLRYASDTALRKAGWYSKGMTHANDAARQAFALLKDTDYPLWCRVSDGAMMESADDRGETT